MLCLRAGVLNLFLLAYPQIKMNPLCVPPKLLFFSFVGLILIELYFGVPPTNCLRTPRGTRTPGWEPLSSIYNIKKPSVSRSCSLTVGTRTPGWEPLSSIYNIKKPSVSCSCSLTVGLQTTFVLRRTDAADREYIQLRTQAMYFALADVSSCNNKSSLLSFCLCPNS